MAPSNDRGPRGGKRDDTRDDRRGGKPDGKRGGTGKSRLNDDAPRRGSGKPRPSAPSNLRDSPPPVSGSGVAVRVSRILDAPASAVFRALNDPARRGWSPEPLYRVVSALAPRFVRLALPDGSQVSVGITRQGNVRCSVAVEQSGLPASVPVNEARDRWMGALAALAEQLDAEWD